MEHTTSVPDLAPQPQQQQLTKLGRLVAEGSTILLGQWARAALTKGDVRMIRSFEDWLEERRIVL